MQLVIVPRISDLRHATHLTHPHTPTEHANNSNNKSYIAFTMYGKGHNSCSKKKEDTYIMDVGKFAKAYVGQKQVDYKYMGNNYGNPDALDYLTCTAVQYNDAYVSVMLHLDCLSPHSLSGSQRLLNMGMEFVHRRQCCIVLDLRMFTNHNMIIYSYPPHSHH